MRHARGLLKAAEAPQRDSDFIDGALTHESVSEAHHIAVHQRAGTAGPGFRSLRTALEDGVMDRGSGSVQHDTTSDGSSFLEEPPSSSQLAAGYAHSPSPCMCARV